MPSITVTPLNNGITLTPPETLVGVFDLSGDAYLYVSSTGDVYFQGDKVTPATLIFSLGFVPTGSAFYFDGISNTFCFVGAAGELLLSTVDSMGSFTNLTDTQVGVHYVGTVFDLIHYCFVVCTQEGVISTVDSMTALTTTVATLTPPGTLPALSTLQVISLTYDYISNAYLILGIPSTNVAPPSVDNYTYIYSGGLATLSQTQIAGKFLTLGAIGRISEDFLFKRRYVVAGENCKFYYSDAGLVWTIAPTIDQAIPVFSLTFNGWVFTAGAQHGIVLLSTEGKIWTSSFDPLLAADVISLSPSTL